MDSEAALDLKRSLETAEFLRTFDGQKANHAFAQAYFDWYQKKEEATKARERISARIKGIMREPPIKQKAPVPTEPVIVTLPARRKKSAKLEDAQRLLARNKHEMSRFHFKVDLILETGELYEPPEHICPFQDFDEYRGQMARQEEEANAERIERLAALATARSAQKRFKAQLIPMNFAVCEGMIYLLYGSETLSMCEREYCDRVIYDAAITAGLQYFPQRDQGNLQYGTLAIRQSEGWMSERYRGVVI